MTAYIHCPVIGRRKIRLFIVILVACIFLNGCGQQQVPVAVPFTAPESFSDKAGLWELAEGGPTISDNRQIGVFFKRNSKLIGSPDWTGQPKKYVRNASKDLKRFYWFSGGQESASWSALEFRGKRARKINGVGPPGTPVSDDS